MTFVGNLGEWGWFWQIVLQKTISIGIVLPKKNVPKFKAGGESLAERFDNALIPIPVLGELMKDARLKPETVRSIKDYSYRPTQLTSGNCLLVGDAAAFVDPINSAGVVMAMYSGFVAAWTIQRILKKPHQNENLKSLFERQVNSRFDLFRLLAYPEHLVTEDMMVESRRILSQLDNREKYLALTQTTLINRATNLSKILGMEDKKFFEEIDSLF